MTASRPLSRRLVALFALACGLSAANLYYAQPLLHTIAGIGAVAFGLWAHDAIRPTPKDVKRYREYNLASCDG